MSDRQFDSYQASILARLEYAIKEAKEKGDFEELDKLAKQFVAELKRP
jgi:hypothetical protein